MKLSEQDAKLFFKLMWELHLYVNRKLKIYPEVQSFYDYVGLAQELKIKVRGALFEDTKIIDSFVRENPHNYSKEELDIVLSWKNFIKGRFFIERLLQKHAIFMNDDEVFAVLGLTQEIDELINPYNLPQYIEAILLPFKGQIVYDSFFAVWPASFGGGVKRDLKEKYSRAKQNNRIIDTLEKPLGENKPQKKDKPIKNWEPELEKLLGQAKKLKSSTNSPAIYGVSFSLIKASIEFGQLAVSDSSTPQSIRKALAKVKRAYNRSGSVLSRED
ncbi:MAG: hypothetical protein PHE87_01955 [Victivallaceae bacterium]|nr:hypothetical protein [Victivallaceae bacterium]